MGDTACNFGYGRVRAVVRSILLAVRKIARDPVVGNTPYTIAVQFIEENRVIDSVEGFTKVEKNSYSEMTFVQSRDNFVH